VKALDGAPDAKDAAVLSSILRGLPKPSARSLRRLDGRLGFFAQSAPQRFPHGSDAPQGQRGGKP
jgi:hypothetical protein